MSATEKMFTYTLIFSDDPPIFREGIRAILFWNDSSDHLSRVAGPVARGRDRYSYIFVWK